MGSVALGLVPAVSTEMLALNSVFAMLFLIASVRVVSRFDSNENGGSVASVRFSTTAGSVIPAPVAPRSVRRSEMAIPVERHGPVWRSLELSAERFRSSRGSSERLWAGRYRR